MKKNFVVVKKVGEKPEMLVVKDELKVYQNFVGGGLIEFVSLKNGVAMIVNEECKFRTDCLPNILIPHLKDVAFGDIVFVVVDEEEGECCNPNEEQLKYIMEYIEQNDITDEKCRKYFELFRG